MIAQRVREKRGKPFLSAVRNYNFSLETLLFLPYGQEHTFFFQNITQTVLNIALSGEAMALNPSGRQGKSIQISHFLHRSSGHYIRVWKEGSSSSLGYKLRNEQLELVCDRLLGAPWESPPVNLHGDLTRALTGFACNHPQEMWGSSWCDCRCVKKLMGRCLQGQLCHRVQDHVSEIKHIDSATSRGWGLDLSPSVMK